MAIPILTTKLYVPAPLPKAVVRSPLLQRLDEGLRRKLTLISAHAGFGKTTLVSAWAATTDRRVAWLSLDEADSDLSRFLTYLVATIRTVVPNVGEDMLNVLQAPQPPPTESILTTLLNEISAFEDNFVLVLDDYHVIEARSVDNALVFLLEHLPPQMRLIIATREDPQLPLARLRARDQLSELRVTDLRFSSSEAADFLNQTMGLDLSPEDIEALETRTEGWIAGLQLAAISMQGNKDNAAFIKSFTGSHHFVLDYLVEEVLQRQPEHIQTFLLHTSILDGLCGPLCDALLNISGGAVSAAGQETLEYLERANLFTIPLDNERYWYRYHHLFAQFLRQRLNQGASGARNEAADLAELHIRASRWYDENGFKMEAFHHAVAANDIERAVRIVQGKGIPLHFRSAVTAILDWLESLPRGVFEEKPSLWSTYASLLLVGGQTSGVDEKLQAAEAALEGAPADDMTRNYIGQVAAARATLALTRYDWKTMIAQSRRALERLAPGSLSLRANANWTLGFGYLFQGDRRAARRTLIEAIALGQAAGSIFTTILATLGLATVQEVDNQLNQAAETYRRILQLAGDQPLQVIGEVHLGLARILYQWNDLEGAEQHGRQGLYLARQYESVIDRFITHEVFLARLRLAQGDIAGAAAILAQASQSAQERNFVLRMPEVAAAQVETLLRQGNLPAAANLAQRFDLPLSQARVRLAQGDSSAALTLLEPLRLQMEAKGWEDERLKVMVLQAIALFTHGEIELAVRLLADVLTLAEPGGYIRLFVDEGAPMSQLFAQAIARGAPSGYARKVQAAIDLEPKKSLGAPTRHNISPSPPLAEPLSQRELEVLQLIAQGFSNNEIGQTLFLALDTVKGHNRKIFDKLQVQRRTEAVARARELGLF
jgi:LuxR family maltose regulon positive regulatory protein